MPEDQKKSDHGLTIVGLAIVAMGLVGGLSQYVHEQTGLSTIFIPPIAGGILLLAILVLHKRGWLRSVGPQDDSLTTERGIGVRPSEGDSRRTNRHIDSRSLIFILRTMESTEFYRKETWLPD